MRPAPVALGPGEEITRMKAVLAACLILGYILAAPPAPALAQSDSELNSKEAIRLENQILELRQELQGLRDQAGRAPATSGGSSLGGYQQAPSGDAASSDMTAQLLSRVQRLEDDMRSLR